MSRGREISTASPAQTVLTHTEKAAADVQAVARELVARAPDPFEGVACAVDGLRVERARVCRPKRYGECVLVHLDMYNADVTIALQEEGADITKRVYTRGGWGSEQVGATEERALFLQEALEALELLAAATQ